MSAYDSKIVQMQVCNCNNAKDSCQLQNIAYQKLSIEILYANPSTAIHSFRYKNFKFWAEARAQNSFLFLGIPGLTIFLIFVNKH